MKTPEQYFLEKEFLPDAPDGAEYTVAEQAFLQKYMGIGQDDAAKAPDLPPPVAARSAPGFGPPPESAAGSSGQSAPDSPDPAGPVESDEPDESDLMQELKDAPNLQLVGFYVDGQEMTVPINVVQEVIRHVAPTQLPAAPHFVAGIINLRGRITPLVRLRELMGLPGQAGENRFIVICRRKGLQLGLMIDTVKTMYRVGQGEIDWAVESHLGAGVEYVAGLLKSEGGKLVGILSVDRIVERVLNG